MCDPYYDDPGRHPTGKMKYTLPEESKEDMLKIPKTTTPVENPDLNGITIIPNKHLTM